MATAQINVESLITQVKQDPEIGGTSQAEIKKEESNNLNEPSWWRRCCMKGSTGNKHLKTSKRSDILSTEIHSEQITKQFAKNNENNINNNQNSSLNILATSGNTSASPPAFLLPPPKQGELQKKLLVLDLDETLVHSQFKPIANPDFILPIEIEAQTHQVFVSKRPHVDNFLASVSPYFELVIFTASLAKYADPVIDNLDKERVISYRLFRDACFCHRGNYVKDLGALGRELSGVIIIDNSPACYMFHPSNAIPITSWFNDPHDRELLDLIPFLIDLASVDNVCTILEGRNKSI